MKLRDCAVYRRVNRVVVPCAALALSLLATAPGYGQNTGQTVGQNGGGNAPPRTLAGFPWDWSHHHVIFSNPVTAAEAARVQQDPRYAHQYYHRNPGVPGIGVPTPAPKSKGLWGESLSDGSGTATVGAGNYPAKYSFTDTMSCSDYVAFNTSLAGSAAVAASQTGTFTTGTPSGTVTITNGTLAVTFTAVASGPATGKVTLSGVPSNDDTVTIGATTYTFVTAAPAAANQVKIQTTGGTGTEEADTAKNLQAAIMATSGSCGSTAPCFGTGTSANASVTATASGAVASLTSRSSALPAGNFILATSDSASITVAGGQDFVAGSSTSTNATNLAAAISHYTNNENSALGVTASAASAAVTVTANAAGSAANSITLGDSLSDFTWKSASLAGGANGQASIAALDNIYSGTCTGTVPSTYWSYNTGGRIATSTVLSEDGSQLVFVHTPASGASSLVILHWHAGDGSLVAPMQLTSVATAADYAACRSSGTAACMYAIPFDHSTNDTNSSPFYDYGGDILYVGDASGYMHKFTGVFNGDPAEVISGWPVTVSTKILTSPVYDANSGNIFVADSGGFLYAYNTSGTLIGNSSRLDVGNGIVAGPMVDSAAGTVYVFVGKDGNAAGTAGCDNTAGCNGVFRFTISAFATTSNIGTTCTATSNTAWATGTNCGKESVFGNAITDVSIYDGTFDNAYYSASTAGSAGNLWACGTGYTGGIPRLVYSPMSSSGFSSANAITLSTLIGNLGSAAATCSPVTEFYNTDDYIYLSVTANGDITTSPACTGACVYSYVVSGTTATVSHGLAAAGGASGIIIDNNGGAGGSQIYFTYLSQANGTTTCPAPSGGAGITASSGGCAVQASQAALQ